MIIHWSTHHPVHVPSLIVGRLRHLRDGWRLINPLVTSATVDLFELSRVLNRAVNSSVCVHVHVVRMRPYRTAVPCMREIQIYDFQYYLSLVPRPSGWGRPDQKAWERG